MCRKTPAQVGGPLVRLGLLVLTAILLSACTASKAAPAQVDLNSLFPADNAIPGWGISQPAAVYTHDNLFNLVNGQAESFFAYGFEQVVVQRYLDTAGTLLNAEIWQLATPADAYGLFSSGRIGTPAAIGNEGDADPGRRLAFWQNRYFISLVATQPVPDATLQAFAQSMAGKLPTGGERPALLDRLPESGLIDQGYLFFHEEISIQMDVWLGGANILGLSQATDGVLGRYQVDDAVARLVLVEYPSSAQAAKALKALQSSGIADLVASDVQGELLGAVFGALEPARAGTILQEALK